MYRVGDGGVMISSMSLDSDNSWNSLSHELCVSLWKECKVSLDRYFQNLFLIPSDSTCT